MGVIYGLVSSKDPTRVRYVGKTVASADIRLKWHLTDASKAQRTRKQKWIKSVLSSGFQVLALDLEEVESNDDLDAAEIRWIAALADLTNGTKGGTGGATTLGYRHSEEAKAVIGNKVRIAWEKRGAPTAAQTAAVQANNVKARAAASKPEVRSKAAKTIRSKRWTDGRICPVCGALFCGLPYKTKHRATKVCSWDCKKKAISAAQSRRHSDNRK